MRNDFLVFGRPAIGQEEINEVIDSFKNKWIGTGPKVAKFEDMFREYIGSKYAVALNSCTAGLHLSLVVNEIGPGDEVITTPMTFCATANVVVHVGAIPIFVDIDKESMNIDVSKIEEKITKKTRAIIPVHFAGRPCEMDKIMEIAKKHNLLVIEDAAHATESEYKGQKIGNIGDMTCFSFYVTKNVITGEGGMVTVNNKELADKLKIYALHGMDKDAWKRYSDQGFKHYKVIFPGYKYNMMDIQAAIGIQQLKKIKGFSKRREEIWQRYNEAFKDLPINIPKDPDPDTQHAYHLYTILIDKQKAKVDRDTFQDLLNKENIGTGVHFISLHLHEYYRKRFGYQPNDFPNAAYISERTISLPFSADLSDQDVDDVILAVKKILNAN
ncbi:MAG: DegT/DnrJ/EryC1/StrS aminotransferase family protein [Candidatus Kuenenia sp.]|nr:DegT/DnrJ/EryC1/StrS aminotransferase family protein [Candidatus Kuenenia hertensis]